MIPFTIRATEREITFSAELPSCNDKIVKARIRESSYTLYHNDLSHADILVLLTPIELSYIMEKIAEVQSNLLHAPAYGPYA